MERFWFDDDVVDRPTILMTSILSWHVHQVRGREGGRVHSSSKRVRLSLPPSVVRQSARKDGSGIILRHRRSTRDRGHRTRGDGVIPIAFDASVMGFDMKDETFRNSCYLISGSGQVHFIILQ